MLTPYASRTQRAAARSTVPITARTAARITACITTCITACLTTFSAVPATAQAPMAPASARSTIQVQNDRSVPVTVFIERGDFDVRLGRVDAMRTSTLALPAWVVMGNAKIELFVHPDGENDLASQSFDVQPGAQLAMIVQPGDYPAWTPAPDDTMSTVLDRADRNATTVTVENPRKEDVTVYVEQGDFDLRLGVVHAGQTRTLRFPEGIAGERQSVELFVTPEHGFDLSSQPMEISRGAHLGLKVPVS